MVKGTKFAEASCAGMSLNTADFKWRICKNGSSPTAHLALVTNSVTKFSFLNGSLKALVVRNLANSTSTNG